MGLIGVLGVLLELRPYYIVPVIFIILYNIPILRHRYKMLLCAYTNKASLTQVIKRAHENFILNFLHNIGLFLIVVCLIVAVIKWGVYRGIQLIISTILVIVVRRYFKLTATTLLYAISVIVIICNLIGRVL